jgi:hypothetical protein
MKRDRIKLRPVGFGRNSFDPSGVVFEKFLIYRMGALNWEDAKEDGDREQKHHRSCTKRVPAISFDQKSYARRLRVDALRDGVMLIYSLNTRKRGVSYELVEKYRSTSSDQTSFAITPSRKRSQLFREYCRSTFFPAHPCFAYGSSRTCVTSTVRPPSAAKTPTWPA